MLNKFGLELRKIGSLNYLYRDIDNVLNSNGIENGQINQEIQSNAIAHSLQKMLVRDNYFSVCSVEKCAKMACITITTERLQIYNSAHCMNYSDMTSEYRQILTAMVLDDFRSVLNPVESQMIKV